MMLYKFLLFIAIIFSYCINLSSLPYILLDTIMSDENQQQKTVCLNILI